MQLVTEHTMPETRSRPEGFDHKLMKYHDRLKGYAMKLTRHAEEAEDLTQETFLKAVANKNKFQGGSNLQAWLHTIMRNTYITQYNRQNKYQAIVSQGDSPRLAYIFEYTTENQGKQSLLMDEINRALQGLEAQFRTPFLMHFKGYKYREIAEILEMPLGTVKNRIHVAKKFLQQQIQR